METSLLILGIIVAGFVFGMAARLILPGDQPLSLAETTIVGMVGAAIGALGSNFVYGDEGISRIDLITVIGGVVGSVIVLAIATWLAEHFGWRRAPDPTLAELIAGGESDTVEFKSTARWNVHTSGRDERLELVIAKTVAGFLNAHGGTLVIGVDDNGRAVGLDQDLTLMKSPDHDRYQLWLTDLLERLLGKPAMAFVTIGFESYGGDAVVVVRVDASDRPVFLDEPRGDRTADFYVRMGNSTRRMLTDEFADYQRSRWK